MHDMLEYIKQDPVHRRWHHNQVTFSMLYAFTENFVLPFSHDEVVHGKRAMLDKMPGDLWQKHANLRSLYGYMFAHPGKKLLFMGSEFGQWREWNYDTSLDWHLLQYAEHQGLRQWVQDLNHTYQRESSLHEVDFDYTGFQWVDCCDNENSVMSFLRRAKGRCRGWTTASGCPKAGGTASSSTATAHATAAATWATAAAPTPSHGRCTASTIRCR